MASAAQTENHRQLSISHATTTTQPECNKVYKPSPKRILSYVSNATSNNVELEEIMEEVLLLSDYEDQKSTEENNITPNNKYKVIAAQEEPEDNILSTTLKCENAPSKPYKSEWNDTDGCYDKFVLYVQDVCSRKTIYLSMVCHLIDITTDIGAVVEFGIVAHTHSSQQCGVDVWYLFCISMICLLTYRCISAYQVWRITGSHNRLIRQLFEVEIYKMLYLSHIMGFVHRVVPFRLICTLETIFESAPQLLIQLIYLTLIKNDSGVVILSTIFSCINVVLALIGENKHTCKEITDINGLIINNKYQDAIELIVYTNSNIDHVASQLYGDEQRRYSLLAMAVVNSDNNRIFQTIVKQKGLDDFGDDEYVTALFMACYKRKLKCIQSIICSTHMNIRYMNKTIYGTQTTAFGHLIMYGTVDAIVGVLKSINKWLRCYKNREAIKIAILNKTGGDKGNALHLACYRQNASLNVFKILCQFYGHKSNKKAALEKKNHNGETVLDYCIKKEMNEIKAFLFNQQLIERPTHL